MAVSSFFFNEEPQCSHCGSSLKKNEDPVIFAYTLYSPMCQTKKCFRRFRSCCTCAVHHWGLCSSSYILHIHCFVRRQQRHRLRCPHIPEDTFSLGTAQIMYTLIKSLKLICVRSIFYHYLITYLLLTYLLTFSGERMCTILVNRWEDYACPVNVWLGNLTALDMTPLGWLGRKTSTQTSKLTYLLT